MVAILIIFVVDNPIENLLVLILLLSLILVGLFLSNAYRIILNNWPTKSAKKWWKDREKSSLSTENDEYYYNTIFGTDSDQRNGFNLLNNGNDYQIQIIVAYHESLILKPASV